MNFRNLTGVEASIATMFGRVELAKAKIYAFQIIGNKCGDVNVNVIGIKQYRDGQAVVFVRNPSSWTAIFRKPADQCALRWENAGSANDLFVLGPSDVRHVTGFQAIGQYALDRLSSALDKVHGKQFDPADHGRQPHDERYDPNFPTCDPSDLLEKLPGYDPEWIPLYEPAPGQVVKHSRTVEQEIARLEITALRSLGRSRESSLGTASDIYECDAEAANIAWVNIDRGGEEHKRIMASIAALLKDEVRLTEAALDSTHVDDTVTRCEIAQRFEWLLEKRMYWLWELDRKKEAESLANKAALVRLELTGAYNFARLKYMRDAATNEEHRMRLAFVCTRLARIIRRMHKNQQAIEVKLLMDLAAAAKDALSPFVQNQLAHMLKQDPALPYYNSGAGHKFGHYDW
jgi:hypothetical protein